MVKLSDMNLQESLNIFVTDPYNPKYNFDLGQKYEQLGHTASAAGFYIRTTEFGNDELLIYEALLRLSLCFSKQGSRVFTVKGILLRAVSLIPDRPEAYFLLARTYEQNKDWQEAYTWGVLGDRKFSNYDKYHKLYTDVEYPGYFGFTFERAVAAWWIGLYSESLSIFRKLICNSEMQGEYRKAANNNLKLSDSWQYPLEYEKSMHERLKIKFPGSTSIERNFSQCYQDIFILMMLKGKKYGSFVEIGCGDPFFGNNTALLEHKFMWSGISIDIDEGAIKKFRKVRSGKIICQDALKIDFESILENKDYDYLQIDCDPSYNSLQVLLRIPFKTHKFAVITFEHDHYLDETNSVRDRSRKYLLSLGYKLVIPDVSMNEFNSFEDWWIRPDLIEKNSIHLNQNNLVNKIENCIFNLY
jgi:tetratricopeptide (TPR) repeat protein